MRTQLSESVQDYVKVIYKLTMERTFASTNEIAQQMGVTPASATGMIQKLANSEPVLVIYRKHQGAALTDEGKRTALEIIRHHRLLETYLVTALGYSWDNVHEEANRLDHAISEEFEKRIAAAMGDPQRDPHGEPIPNAELVMPMDVSRPLSLLQPHERATIKLVHIDDPALLRYLESIGITIGAEVEVLSTSPFDQTIELQADAYEPETLGPAITNRVFVELI